MKNVGICDKNMFRFLVFFKVELDGHLPGVGGDYCSKDYQRGQDQLRLTQAAQLKYSAAQLYKMIHNGPSFSPPEPAGYVSQSNNKALFLISNDPVYIQLRTMAFFLQLFIFSANGQPTVDLVAAPISKIIGSFRPITCHTLLLGFLCSQEKAPSGRSFLTIVLHFSLGLQH